MQLCDTESSDENKTCNLWQIITHCDKQGLTAEVLIGQRDSTEYPQYILIKIYRIIIIVTYKQHFNIVGEVELILT